jgi:hypothetical protein
LYHPGIKQYVSQYQRCCVPVRTGTGEYLPTVANS